MAKIITKKSQIPKYAAKKIKDFKKLTTNQAIYEYELIKLQRRAKGDFASYAKGYYARPERVTQKAIKQLQSLKGKKLQTEIQSYNIEQRINRAVIQEPAYYEPEDSIPDIDYTPSYEPDYSFDLNEEIEQEKSYQSPDDYLEETGQVVNPLSGEVISADNIVDMVDFARQFLDEIARVVADEETRAIISNSSYRNGRTRNAKSRQWITDNIQRAGDAITGELYMIGTSEERMIAFAKKYSNPDRLSALTEAIGEYINASYSSTNTGSFQASLVYSMLHDSPLSLDEAMEFEDEE